MMDGEAGVVVVGIVGEIGSDFTRQVLDIRRYHW